MQRTSHTGSYASASQQVAIACKCCWNTIIHMRPTEGLWMWTGLKQPATAHRRVEPIDPPCHSRNAAAAAHTVLQQQQVKNQTRPRSSRRPARLVGSACRRGAQPGHQSGTMVMRGARRGADRSMRADRETKLGVQSVSEVGQTCLKLGARP